MQNFRETFHSSACLAGKECLSEFFDLSSSNLTNLLVIHQIWGFLMNGMFAMIYIGILRINHRTLLTCYLYTIRIILKCSTHEASLKRSKDADSWSHSACKYPKTVITLQHCAANSFIIVFVTFNLSCVNVLKCRSWVSIPGHLNLSDWKTQLTVHDLANLCWTRPLKSNQFLWLLLARDRIDLNGPQSP